MAARSAAVLEPPGEQRTTVGAERDAHRVPRSIRRAVAADGERPRMPDLFAVRSGRGGGCSSSSTGAPERARARAPHHRADRCLGPPGHDRRAAVPQRDRDVAADGPEEPGRRTKSPPGSRSNSTRPSLPSAATSTRPSGHRQPGSRPRRSRDAQQPARRAGGASQRRRRSRPARRRRSVNSTSVSPAPVIARTVAKRGSPRRRHVSGGTERRRPRARRADADVDAGARRSYSIHSTTASPRAETATSGRVRTLAGERDGRAPAAARVAQRDADAAARSRRRAPPPRSACAATAGQPNASPSGTVPDGDSPSGVAPSAARRRRVPAHQLARHAGRPQARAAARHGPERQLAERRRDGAAPGSAASSARDDAQRDASSAHPHARPARV